MKDCAWFTQHWDAYLDHRMTREDEQDWNAHAARCSDCAEAWRAWQKLQPMMAEDRALLSKEPSPFFFARQLRQIETKIATKATQRWWQGAFAKPAFAMAMLALMVASWTVFQSGNLPFLATDEETRVAQEMLLSEDMIFMLFDVLSQAEDTEALALLL